MVSATCKVCLKPFPTKLSRIYKGWGKYCSNECKHTGFKTGKQVSCSVCQQMVYRTIKDHLRSESGLFFCSKSCQARWRNTIYVGERHANWKSGEKSYREILKRSGQAPVCKKCQTEDSRILAVHHKDRNRQNNVLNNLVWLCHNCHYLVHHYTEEREGLLVK